MRLAVDVDYRENTAHTAGVLFRHWEDTEAIEQHFSTATDIQDYVPGQFYKRELPCILKLLNEHSLMPECVVIDGYVFLDGDRRPGLGKHLYDALLGEVAVIGVAKKPFSGIPDTYKLCRGGSKVPLYITAIGIDVADAKSAIASMHGDFRIPTLLKMADRACRAE